MHEGKALRELIIKQGLEIKEFAGKMDISRQTLSGYFKISELSKSIKEEACKILGVSPDVFKDTTVSNKENSLSQSERESLWNIINAQKGIIERLEQQLKDK